MRYLFCGWIPGKHLPRQTNKFFQQVLHLDQGRSIRDWRHRRKQIHRAQGVLDRKDRLPSKNPPVPTMGLTCPSGLEIVRGTDRPSSHSRAIPDSPTFTTWKQTRFQSLWPTFIRRYADSDSMRVA